MYKYKNDSKYFNLLNEKYDLISSLIESNRKKQKEMMDDDGFVKIVSKKKK